MKIVANEDMYVSTTWGAAIRLYAGEPKEVGDDIGYVAIQQGCLLYTSPSPRDQA